MSKCIEWRHAKSSDGYGYVQLSGKTRSVHRLVFSLVHGYTPDVVRHSCDNPCCYNPDHLLGGDHKDNARDREERNRGNQMFGQRHYKSRLTDKQVEEVRLRYRAGERVVVLAMEYQYSVRGIYSILQNVNRNP